MNDIERFVNIFNEKRCVKLIAHNTQVPFSMKQVIYLEDAYEPRINDYIIAHYQELQIRFRQRDLEFVYIPTTLLTPEQMEYWDPAHCINSPIQLRTSMLYDVMQAEIIAGQLPAIMLCKKINNDSHLLCGITIDKSKPEEAFNRFFSIIDPSPSEKDYDIDTYSADCCCFELNVEEREEAFHAFQKEECTNCEHSSKREHSISLRSLKKSIFKLNAENDSSALEETAEPELTDEEEKLVSEIQRNLELLRSHGLSESVLEKIFAPAVKPSRMLVMKNGTIMLPDYKNRIIEMIPLDKVLYLLLLRHPEGIFQKDLSDYIEEMKELYCRINDGFLPQRALKGILSLANPLSNSCNEKISRIRNVFLSHFQPAIAAFYTISSGRAEARRIPLDPGLVEWE